MPTDRVVVTGMGVCAPNAVGVNRFLHALKSGTSGIRHLDTLEALNFRCQLAGIPDKDAIIHSKHAANFNYKKIKSTGILYGVQAGLEAWSDAGLSITSRDSDPDWTSGCIFGSTINGIEAISDTILPVDSGNVRRLGSRTVPQAMNSGVSAYLGGILGLGNQVTTNSAACNTGTEAILSAYSRIKHGYAERMIAGGSDSSSRYIWGAFDALRILNSKSNDSPALASCPLRADHPGFVPGSGGGALVLESLEHAQRRNAKIYVEVLGGHINSGGQRAGGSIAAVSLGGMVRCIQQALHEAEVTPEDIDAISGHLTSTQGDLVEVTAWTKALNRSGPDFPFINAPKSLIGHCLGGAGAIECVAAVLQLHHGFLHESANAEPIDPAILELIPRSSVVRESFDTDLRYVAKSSFGFGDVNSCVVFGRPPA